MKLLLARHGLTEWNATQRFQGRSDGSLNDIGRQQARALSRRLGKEDFHVICTSDLQRAIQTTQVIAEQRNCPIVLEPRLREVYFGSWEGLTYAEIQRRDPEVLAEWESNFLEVHPPDGETLTQLAQRVNLVLQEIRQKYSEQKVLLVSHAGPLQVLVCLAMGFSPSLYWQFHIAQGSLSEIAFHPAGAILNLLNDTSHLAKLNV